MARPTDEWNTNILPEQELNPLLNPLLGAHMGRWAEVYFTSPPEKRAQAVSDLVRELTNQSTVRSGQPEAEDPPRTRWPVRERATFDQETQERDELPVPRFIEPPEPSLIPQEPAEESLVCDSCGHRNAAEQRFCSMCGRPLGIALPFSEPEPMRGENANDSRLSVERPAESEYDIAPEAAHSDRDSESLHWASAHEAPPEFTVLSGYESQPTSHGYKIYLGAVVAILLGLLVYMTWRSNTAFWSGNNHPSSLPEAVPTQKSEPEATAQPSATPSAQPNNTAASKTASTSAAKAQSPAVRHVEKTRKVDQRSVNQRSRATARAVPPSQHSAPNTAEGDGSEELATAEKYLHAGPENARNTQQAATWLWKAVAKQNSTATLLLSDLYLRGDGVTKNCDQARLLLDAAARKGQTAAAQRLRNLQAFGCR